MGRIQTVNRAVFGFECGLRPPNRVRGKVRKGGGVPLRASAQGGFIG
jgi:hypothetical protein